MMAGSLQHRGGGGEQGRCGNSKMRHNKVSPWTIGCGGTALCAPPSCPPRLLGPACSRRPRNPNWKGVVLHHGVVDGKCMVQLIPLCALVMHEILGNRDNKEQRKSTRSFLVGGSVMATNTGVPL